MTTPTVDRYLSHPVEWFAGDDLQVMLGRYDARLIDLDLDTMHPYDRKFFDRITVLGDHAILFNDFDSTHTPDPFLRVYLTEEADEDRWGDGDREANYFDLLN